MKIDYTITFKDALSLAIELLRSNDIMKNSLSSSLRHAKDAEIDINYQIAFELCEIAKAICDETMKRSNS